MGSTTSESFWKGYGTVMGGTFVWGLLCAFQDGRASDWPPFAQWLPGQRSLLEVPIVVLAWMALATLVFIGARIGSAGSMKSSKPPKSMKEL